MSATKSASEIAAPQGMTGIACEPWTPGEIYAVAADWGQASCPVMVWGDGEWTQDECGRQVADFRHSPQSALRDLIYRSIRAGGDDPDKDEVAGIVEDALEIRSHAVGEMCDLLDGYGERFSGNCVEDQAQDWLDHGFTADDAGQWCEIGCWDAPTAAEFRDSGKTPEQIADAAEVLAAAEDDPTDTYTDGDPIYSACNNDTNPQIIIAAVE